MKQKQVIIVGAGMAGLAAASHLQRLGCDPLVLEAAAQPGGNVKTVPQQGYLLELGPNTIMGSARDVFELIEMHGLTGQLARPHARARQRYIVRSGKLHPAPMGIKNFLTTGLLSARSKLRLMSEPWRTQRGHDGDSAYQFFVRRFGEEAARVLAGAFISGVYAGDIHKLSAADAFPLFWGFEQNKGSMIRGALAHKAQLKKAGLTSRPGLYSLAGGLGTLTSTMAAQIGTRLQLNEPVLPGGILRIADGWQVQTAKGTYEAGQLIVATPPHQAASLLAKCDTRLAAHLAGIEMAKVAVVYLSYDINDGQLPEGFGFLTPRDEGTRMLGAIFSSSLFEDRAPSSHRLLTAFVGGVCDSAALKLDDGALYELVREDLRRLGILPRRTELITVIRHDAAIPQLNLGHHVRIQQMNDLLRQKHPGLQLAGNYLSGVGMKDAATSGKTAALCAAKNQGCR